MKKVLLLLVMLGAFAVRSYASDLGATAYNVNDAQIDQLFNQAEDVTLSVTTEALTLATSNLDASAMLKEQTKVGFLLRAFFCGSFALHRYYMGVGDKKSMWAYYFCIPGVGGFVGCVDFWYVVIKGDEAMNKYKDNPKFIVW